MNDDKKPSYHLDISSLIEIFYGLAIVSGLDFVISWIFETPNDGSKILIASGAFMLSIGDWAIYHFFIAQHRYKSIFRVVMDIIIILAIFLVYRTVSYHNLFCIIVTVYFILGSCYYFLLKKEQRAPKYLKTLTLSQFVLAGIAVTLIVISTLKNDFFQFYKMFSIIGILWGLLNLIAANSLLRDTN